MQSAYTGEHDEYRRVLDPELEPNIEKFVAAGGHDTSFWKKAGAAGMLGVTIPEEYGGPGGDKLFNVIQSDEVGGSHIIGAHFGSPSSRFVNCINGIPSAWRATAIRNPGH